MDRDICIVDQHGLMELNVNKEHVDMAVEISQMSEIYMWCPCNGIISGSVCFTKLEVVMAWVVHVMSRQAS